MSNGDFQKVASALEEDMDYLVEDLRDDLGDGPAYSLVESSAVDDRNSEIVTNDFALARAYYNSRISENYRDKSTKINRGLAAAGFLGTAGSASMLGAGEPLSFASGLLSAGIGVYGLTNLKIKERTHKIEEESKEALDSLGLDDYSITLSESSEADFMEEKSSSGDVKAYTAEELEEMSDEELLN